MSQPIHTSNPILFFLTNKRLAIVRHILFVLVMALVYSLLSPETMRLYAEKVNVPFEVFYIGQCIDMLVSLGLIYFNLYFLFPRYFKKNLYTQYLIGIFFSAIICFFVSYFIQQIYVICFGKIKEYALQFTLLAFIESVIFPVVFLCATTGYKVFKEWIADQERFATLAKEKLNAELSQLKTQINPHFLFNTLNNLNVLIQTNPDKASDIVLGLSDVLRYQIYDSQHDSVSLSKDIEIIEQYLELEKIRRDDLNIHVVKNGNFSGILVPPLLFTNFVDNAIKHSNLRGASFINIFFKVENKMLYFEIANSKSGQKTNTENSGLGLQNVKKRLDLLYGAAHSLKITDEAELFLIKLSIPL
jgi:sensor histidine kinase YesM